MNENTHSGHRERVRRRVAGEGLRALEPHEVIEFLLYYVLPRQDVNATAHRLIDRFGNVAGVLKASAAELTTVQGVGTKTADFLVKVGRTMEACSYTDIEERISMGRMDTALKAIRAFGKMIPSPSTCLMCLDMDSRLLYRREITPSLAWGEPEIRREVLEDILMTRARCAIIALYGSDRVDSYDILSARETAFILHECGVMLLDVLVVNEDSAISMRREGLIPEFEKGAEAAALCETYLREEAMHNHNGESNR